MVYPYFKMNLIVSPFGLALKRFKITWESQLKKIFKDYWFLFLIAGIILILDQISKALVRNNIPFGGQWIPFEWLSSFFRFVHWENTGAAFGLGQNLGLIFTLLAFVVIGAILYYFPQIDRSDWLIRVALSLQMGGAIGNLTDRLIHDYVVTDFISVGGFPVFNVADASISVGTAVLILGVWIQEKKHKHLQTLESESAL